MHAIVAAALRQRILVIILGGTLMIAGLFAYQTLAAGAVERLAAEHAAIARAFAAADGARVRALVHDHVRAAGSDALERLPGHQDHQAEEIS